MKGGRQERVWREKKERGKGEEPRKKPIGVEGFRRKKGRPAEGEGGEAERTDRKGAIEGVINGNEDCLAKCE